MAFGEIIAADEAERFRGFAEEIAEIQRARALKHGAKPVRALHVKQHLGAVGELVVKAPESARSGVFAMSGKSWPVYARFSNGHGKRQADKQPDIRGFALKLVGVPGQKLIRGLESELTQDFSVHPIARHPLWHARRIHEVHQSRQGRTGQVAAQLDLELWVGAGARHHLGLDRGSQGEVVRDAHLSHGRADSPTARARPSFRSCRCRAKRARRLRAEPIFCAKICWPG